MNQSDGIVTKVITVVGQGVAASTTYFGLTLNEIGVVFGIISSALMIGITFYFQWRRDKREEHAAKTLERRKGGQS